MSIKEIRNKAKINHEKNTIGSWMISIMLILIVVLGCLFLFIDSVFSLLAIPLLIIPAYFSITIMHMSFSYENTANLSSFFKFFQMYFQKPYLGSFSIFKNLLRTLIFSIGASIVFSILGFIICSAIDSEGLMMAFESLTNALMSGKEFVLSDVLGENAEIYHLLELISTIPASLITYAYFVYLIVRNTLSVYLRMSFPKANPNFLTNVFEHTCKKHKKELTKKLWGLNWPLAVLFLTGLISGALVGLFALNNSSFVGGLALIFAFVLSTPFIPYMFANMEELYKDFQEKFVNGSISVTNIYLKNLQSSIDINEEEKQALEQMLNNLENPLEDVDEENDDKSS